MKYHPKTKPDPWQHKPILNLVRERNHALLMDPGTGKTKVWIDAACILRLKKEVYKVLVVCPLSALGVWEDELELHCPLPYALWAPGQGLRLIHDHPRIVFALINYDLYRQRSRPGKRWVYPYSQWFEKWQPDLVILDESHRAKRAGAVTSQILWRSVRRMRQKRRDGRPFVQPGTGTPQGKGYVDIFAQYRIMDDTIFGTDKASFEEEYVRYGHGRRRFTIIGYNNKEVLIAKIHKHATVVPDDVLKLAPPRWQNVRVLLPPKARKLYYQMAEELVAEWEAGVLEAANAGVRRIRLLQITGGFSTAGDEIHREKVRYAADILADLQDQRQHVVVYARFLPEVHALGEVCEKHGLPHVVVEGATKRGVRDRAVRDFQRLGGPRALVFQVSTGSLAITLTAAHEVIYYSLPDGWIDYWQSSKRTRRRGQTKSVRYRHLICPGTVDVSQLRALRARADVHAELMGNVRRFVFGG